MKSTHTLLDADSLFNIFDFLTAKDLHALSLTSKELSQVFDEYFKLKNYQQVKKELIKPDLKGKAIIRMDEFSAPICSLSFINFLTISYFIILIMVFIAYLDSLQIVHRSLEYGNRTTNAQLEQKRDHLYDNIETVLGTIVKSTKTLGSLVVSLNFFKDRINNAKVKLHSCHAKFFSSHEAPLAKKIKASNPDLYEQLPRTTVYSRKLI